MAVLWSSSYRWVTLYMFVTLDNNLPCHCEPRLVGAWQSHCKAGACYNWTEEPRLEIASSLSLLAMTKKVSLIIWTSTPYWQISKGKLPYRFTISASSRNTCFRLKKSEFCICEVAIVDSYQSQCSAPVTRVGWLSYRHGWNCEKISAESLFYRIS